MIRKFALALMLLCILISCGKKGDPEYKGNSMIQGQKITI